jgi:preprotein translocase subunit SecF
MSEHNKPESKENSHNAYDHKNNFFSKVYDKHYKSLLIISMLILIFSVVVIGHQFITTGDFVKRGVSLTGGISLTLQASTNNTITPDELQSYLSKTFPKADITVGTFGTGSKLRFSVEATGVEDTELINALQPKFPNLTYEDFAKNKQTIGPTFGNAFFTQTLKAIFIAFLFMSIIIFLYFGDSTRDKWIASTLTIVAAFMMFYAKSTLMYIIPLILLIVLIVIYIRDSIPAFGIILCAFSDILFSLAIFNLFGHKLSVASVAAFLMLVGYSIDTDILLSVRVLKRKEGTIYHRIVGALKTGITMSVCTLIAVLSAYFLTNSTVIKEIMFVLIWGLIGDILFTWIQNAGILRWHLEKKGWK